MDNAKSRSGQGPYSWMPIAAWLVAALAIGLTVGCGSGGLQQGGYSLLVVQSLAVGGIVAVMLLGAGGILQGKPPWWSALLAAIATVVVQHLWLYRAAMAARRAAVAESPAVELFKPGWSEQGLFSYLWEHGQQPNGAHWELAEWPNAVLWGLDACLLILAAVAIVGWVGRRRVQPETTSGGT